MSHIIKRRFPRSKLLRGQTKIGKDGVPLMRVKPFPDPRREDSTKWMTEEGIETESRKPSAFWVEAGSGSLFKGVYQLVFIVALG